MRANRERCLELCEIDENDPGACFPREVLLPALWSQISGPRLPLGLDSFCLDAAVMCGAETVIGWFKVLSGSTRSLDWESFFDGTSSSLTPENAMGSIELLWRRRLRIDPGWREHGPAWSNRINRAKRRALKMIHSEMELEPF